MIFEIYKGVVIIRLNTLINYRLNIKNRYYKKITLNFGPQHLVVHGVSRSVLKMNGEVVELRHEGADAESTPMSLAMSRLII
ncbi:hypothetical protein LINPERPRIM_LOCUS9950 [Linum perenne]